MERRYLVATLALVATFAIFSREFRSGHLANLPCTRAELKAEIACAKHYLADQLDGEAAPVRRSRRSRRAADGGGVESARAGRGQRKGRRDAGTDRATDCREQLRGGDACARACSSRPGSRFRAQERGLRAAERAQERVAEINVRIQERAQEISARAMERAQRALERQHSKMAYPVGMPVHVRIETASPSFAVPVTVAPVPPIPPTPRRQRRVGRTSRIRCGS